MRTAMQPPGVVEESARDSLSPLRRICVEAQIAVGIAATAGSILVALVGNKAVQEYSEAASKVRTQLSFQEYCKDQRVEIENWFCEDLDTLEGLRRSVPDKRGVEALNRIIAAKAELYLEPNRKH